VTDRSARDRLIVALDLSSAEEARALVRELADAVSFYKIGLELILAGGGLGLARVLKSEGKKVFLDAKLLDIANTVERAVKAAAGTGADFLTVHAHDRKTLRAAVAGRDGTNMKLLAVTVLTHLTSDDLEEQGIAVAPGDLVLRRAQLALQAGCDGVVASGEETHRLRSEIGGEFLIVTPGIRLPGGPPHDQARVATPSEAISAGSDYLVVGRPITKASDPRQAAALFLREIAHACARGSVRR
jgi:orotidine-5'-phosphate decarboxylase